MDFLIASRRDRPGDDPIFSLNAEAKARAAAGEDIVNATIGTLLDDGGKFAVMSAVMEAFGELDAALISAYAPISGRPEFLSAVTEDLLGAAGVSDQVVAVATPGGSGALRMAIDNFTEPGQQVLTSSYYWPPYKTLATEAGRQLATFNMFAEDGTCDVAALATSLDELIESQGRVLLFLNTPCHNPTGYSLDQKEWDGVVDVIAARAARAPITLLVDVAYGYYQPTGLQLAIDNALRLVGDALVLFAWSASKSFAQYGMRIGACLAVSRDDAERKRIANALTFSCRGLWSNCNAGGMSAIARVLTDPQYRGRVIEQRAELSTMLARRVACWNELARAKRLPYPRYDGGFFTTVFCDDAPAVCARMRKRGIFVVPTSGAIRVALCSINEAQVGRVVDALAEELNP